MNGRICAAGLIGSLALVLSGCATSGGDTTSIPAVTTSALTTTATTATTTAAAPTSMPAPATTTAGRQSAVVPYFFLDSVGEGIPGPHLVPVHRPAATDGPEAAIEALLAGPTVEETTGTPSISTAIPEGTTLLGLAIADGLATVDLSDAFDDGGGSASVFGRLAQFVYTLTRYAEVDRVAFMLAGEPVEVFSAEGIVLDRPQTRDDYTDQRPAIFVDTPAWGAPVDTPVTVSGLANVFEAVFHLTFTDDDGLPLHTRTVMASCGTGCWGEFEVTFPYAVDRPQLGALLVFEASPRDGSPINVREYPVRLR